ncbi:MAG: alpha/beta hydrolase [Sphingobacterium sp.]|jgi:pimeloyl-ACP methyl ester carboxylesterase|nr:alpha/beta hydrolase [Sphingobacterium sp.]
MKQQIFTGRDGQKLYVELHTNYRDRPTIVFLHDSLGCVTLWRDFPEQLAAVTNCNVLMYDRLGYGQSDPMPTSKRSNTYLESEADILSQLLQEQGLRDVILFGHSDGASIALIAASKYPRGIKSVIVEAAHIFVEDITLRGICEAMEAYKTTNLPERLAKYHGDKVDTIFKAWTETWTSNDYRDWNIEHLLSRITCPLLFIQGESDEYGTLSQVEKTVRQVGGRSEKYIIPGVGHTPHKEVPDLVSKVVSKFINTLV